MNHPDLLSAGTNRDGSRSSIVAIAVLTAISLLLAVTPLYAQGAAEIYSQKCASCHGAKGKGDGPAGKYLNPKPRDFAVSLKGKSDDWIAKAITKGGPSVGESSVMPSYSDLTGDQTKSLVGYLKHLGT